MESREPGMDSMNPRQGQLGADEECASCSTPRLKYTGMRMNAVSVFAPMPPIDSCKSAILWRRPGLTPLNYNSNIISIKILPTG